MSMMNDLLGTVMAQCGTQAPPQAGAQAPAPAQRGLLEGVLGMVGGAGGVGALLDAFRQKGLGETVQSWIGLGANQQITGAQVTESLGAGKLGELAAKLGLSTDATASQLANVLPQFIDKLTPNGKLPDSAAMSQVFASLKNSLASQTTGTT